MKSGDKFYIRQHDDWPNWTYNPQRLEPLLAQVHRAQGRLLGRMHDMGLDLKDQAACVLNKEMQRFLNWFNSADQDDLVVKAGLAHLWFVTIHPFEDGNGRIARAVGDMVLARAERSAQRYYSLSAQIQRERKDYYDQLESTQKGDLDVTSWLTWFLQCLLRAGEQAEETLATVLAKARFWRQLAGTRLNDRQIKLLNKLLEGFEGKLTSSKWASIAKCSQDTALRDITDLLERGVLRKSEASGRSTSYLIGLKNGTCLPE